jgi:hypothetical protein
MRQSLEFFQDFASQVTSNFVSSLKKIWQEFATAALRVAVSEWIDLPNQTH